MSTDACLEGAWSFEARHRATGELRWGPFRCRSWRCTACRRGVDAQDYQRLRAALEEPPESELLFLTCTFDPADWPSAAAAWRAAREVWKRLVDALRYRYGPRRGGVLKYAQTWEQHRSGWPHVHAVVWAPLAALELRRMGGRTRRCRATRRRRFVPRWEERIFRPLARRAGFGRICEGAPARAGPGGVAGYLVKLAGELVGGAKKGQTPLAAPKGFRRLRASPRWLPPRRLPSEWTGRLVLAPCEEIQSVERSSAGGVLELRLAIRRLELHHRARRGRPRSVSRVLARPPPPGGASPLDLRPRLDARSLGSVARDTAADALELAPRELGRAPRAFLELELPF